MALDTASGAIARRDDAANGSGEQHSVLPHLDTPTSFPFPYTPYQIQLDLMKTVFGAIEDGKIAIVGLHRSDSTDVQVSSPTGTGKSLTLLTSTLSWLSAHQKRLDKATEDDLRRRFKEDDPDGKLSSRRKQTDRSRPGLGSGEGCETSHGRAQGCVRSASLTPVSCS